MKHVLSLMPLAALMSCMSPLSAETASGEQPIVFETASGETVDAYQGRFQVPENRSSETSREITIQYVRFPATGENAGAPIVYLAGGPGGSGITTAKYDRFPLFMAMREFGDVIAYDQRGTGASNDLPDCTSDQHISSTEAVSDADYFAAQQAAFAECLVFWEEAGIDVRGYTTPENAADLEALRQHLGADQIDLWGISYGSHLALAAIKQMDDRLGRVVITAIEGLDQTVKQPVRSDQYFDRLQAAIDTDPVAKAKFPDVRALIARVLAKLEETPLLLEIPTASGDTAPFLLQRRHMQQFTSGLVADPARVVLILGVYDSLDNGDTQMITGLLQQAVDPTDTAISMRPMSYLMDVASGSGVERRAMLWQQAETALLGAQMNFSLPLETVDPSLDLGENFRTLPISDVPTLVLSGTLDGRTFLESGAEATAGLAARQTVIVENAGHNLFMMSPEVTETIQDFLRGENVDGRRLTVPLPSFE